jgi:hypothetical protein
MTETYLAWAILSIAFFLGLFAALKDPRSFKSRLIDDVVILLSIAVGSFGYAIFWALSVVMA